LKKILIVEDDQLLNRTLAYNLTSDGYEVISVFNFDSAVRKLRENEFDVALLDINLPDGSGLDLCEEIRNRGQHTYIIFITANDKESDMLKGYEVGGADYVTKPFSVEHYQEDEVCFCPFCGESLFKDEWDADSDDESEEDE
jgi:DNA-binding response OmpR family regulator